MICKYAYPAAAGKFNTLPIVEFHSRTYRIHFRPSPAEDGCRLDRHFTDHPRTLYAKRSRLRPNIELQSQISPRTYLMTLEVPLLHSAKVIVLLIPLCRRLKDVELLSR